jgi:hypothetical protein
MIPTFTHEQLIRFIYNECTPQEKQCINRMIEEIPACADEYRDLKLIYKKLNSEQYEPSKTSVDIIMQHVHSIVHQ